MSDLARFTGWDVHGLDVETIYFDDHHGHRAAALVPQIPDDAPDNVREGLARRRLALTEGRCPCGVRTALPAPQDGSLEVVGLEHRDHCPAVTKNLRRALRKWRGVA